MLANGLLGRVLMDPMTGLPNIPYFEVIKEWEARRAERRNYAVRVLDVKVAGGGERLRRSLGWRLSQLLRASDLIASHGASHFRILLTSPDAENAESVASRVEQLASELNGRHPADPALEVAVAIEQPVSSGAMPVMPDPGC